MAGSTSHFQIFSTPPRSGRNLPNIFEINFHRRTAQLCQKSDTATGEAIKTMEKALDVTRLSDWIFLEAVLEGNDFVRIEVKARARFAHNNLEGMCNSFVKHRI
jgi:hypothetical protein